MDAALHWHHGNVRKGAAPLLFNRVLGPRMGAQANVRLAAESQDLLIVTLKVRLISAFYRNLIL